MSNTALTWNNDSSTVPDGKKVIVCGESLKKPHPREFKTFGVVLERDPENKVWVDGLCGFGDAGLEWPHWMELPAPPKGDDLKGWADSKIDPPRKDGTPYLGLWLGKDKHAGKTYYLCVVWKEDWASSDCGLDGMWTDDLLTHTEVTPDYWMELPEGPDDPEASKVTDKLPPRE